MGNNLFRIWLPLSLGLHLLMIPVFYLIPFAPTPVHTTTYRILHLPDEPAAPKATAPKPHLSTPKKPPVMLPKKLAQATRPIAQPKLASPLHPQKPVTTAPMISANKNPAPGRITRPPDIASPGDLKETVTLKPGRASAPARMTAPRPGPLMAPKLSGGGPGSLDFLPNSAPGPIGAIASSTRGSFAVPAAPIGGLHRGPVTPAIIGNGPGTDRNGVSGLGGLDAPETPNLSRVTTRKPGASAPSPIIASAFVPGLPHGPTPQTGGSWLQADGDPKLPIGLPKGKTGGHGDVVAAPTIPVGKGSGGGTGEGPGRPEHGPVMLSGPTVSYPRLAAKEGNTGVVIVSVKTNPDGVVVSAKLERRSEADSLDNEAIRAARKWSFRPAEDSDGRQISGAARLRFVFAKDKKPEVTQL